MTNEYSVQIQNYISEKILVAEKMKTTVEKQDDFATQKYYEGQIDILSDFKEFLIDYLNPKLPRVVREKLF